MKKWVNFFILFIVFICICVIAYVRLRIGFPIWRTEDYQDYNMVFENLSYSVIAGAIIYFLTIVLPDYLEYRHLKPIIDKKIGHIGELFNKQLWGFSISTSETTQQGLDYIDCTNIEDSISILEKADWNAVNQTVNNTRNNKLYQTYKQDYDAIVLVIADILRTYKTQLSQDDIQHFENIRQADFITKLNVLYDYEATFPEGGQDFIVKGHRKLLEDFNHILKDRKIKLS